MSGFIVNKDNKEILWLKINCSCQRSAKHFQLISYNFNMLVSLNNIHCWTLLWEATCKYNCESKKMLGSVGGCNGNRPFLDFASHFFLPLFWTIVWRCNRRGSYRSSKSWNAVWHSTHIISQSVLIFLLSCFQLVKSTYNQN